MGHDDTKRLPRPSAANEKQIGGRHYKGTEYEFWDYIEDHGIGFMEANAIKYVVRHRTKNGLQDLGKAQHYVEKLLELATSERPMVERVRAVLVHFSPHRRRKPRTFVRTNAVSVFCVANHLSDQEATIVQGLSQWAEPDDLRTIRRQIKNLVTDVLGQRAEPGDG